MAAHFAAAATLLLAAASTATAQQMGKLTPEVHPKFPTQECTVAGGCVTKTTSIVLDSDYRWTHTVDGYDNCKGPAGLDKELCANATACSANCALEGVDYESYGIYSDGKGQVRLTLFVNKTDLGTSMSSPRVYILANDTHYDMYKMLNKELAFDVDMSQMPCGANSALYFSEMLPDGGRSELNPAGATYGTGYCDAQCPSPPFINGEANLEGYGACCNEMDIWEANGQATAFTPHPCNVTAVYKCKGDLCGNKDRYAGVCDKDGCDYNPYRLGQTTFYQPNATVNTLKPFTVVTQFLTTTGNATGDLREIRRLYVQDGKVIENALIRVPGFDKGNSLTDEFCAKEKETFGGVDAFKQQGGMKGMGESLQRGVVLVMSIWNDASTNMKWLDGTYPPDKDPAKDPGVGRGPCKADEGLASEMAEKAPWVQVTFANVKIGEIGSTYKGTTAM